MLSGLGGLSLPVHTSPMPCLPSGSWFPPADSHPHSSDPSNPFGQMTQPTVGLTSFCLTLALNSELSVKSCSPQARPALLLDLAHCPQAGGAWPPSLPLAP